MILRPSTLVKQSTMNYKTFLAMIVLFHYVHGRETHSFILPDEAINHVWRTIDSDGVIPYDETTTSVEIEEYKNLGPSSYQ